MDNRYFVGVDVGGTNVDALLLDENLEEQAFATAPIRNSRGESPVDVIVQTINAVLVQAGLSNHSLIAAIGVGVPGLVDATTGRVELAVNLDEKSMPLGEILAAHFGRPVFVENDANAVALGAAKFLVDPSVKNLAFITIGTGVGAGLVLNGHIFHGSRNMAGEIGHVFVKESPVRCQCGSYGCLETFVAGPAIARLAQAAIDDEAVETTLKNHVAPDAAVVFSEAAANDPIAQEIVNQVGVILARAMQGMMMSFDLEKIIIGGGISRAGDTLLRPILNEWEKMRANSQMASEMLLPEKLTVCPADYKAGAWGAVAVGLKHIPAELPSASVFQNEPMILGN